jgi:hypothetical protein
MALIGCGGPILVLSQAKGKSTMAITAGFSIKGNLDDGNLLAESIYVHLTAIARRMKDWSDVQTSNGSPFDSRDIPEEYKADQQKFFQLEKLYREITGNNPAFPKVDDHG